VFVAWRDLRFARGRFTLMGGVVILITMLVVMLSGLTAGLGRENTSAVLELPVDHLSFTAPLEDGGVSFSDSTLEAETWEQWAQVPGVEAAEPLAIVTTRVEYEERTAAVSVFGVRPGSPLLPQAAGGTPSRRGRSCSRQAPPTLWTPRPVTRWPSRATTWSSEPSPGRAPTATPRWCGRTSPTPSRSCVLMT